MREELPKGWEWRGASMEQHLSCQLVRIDARSRVAEVYSLLAIVVFRGENWWFAVNDLESLDNGSFRRSIVLRGPYVYLETAKSRAVDEVMRTQVEARLNSCTR
jgi:hypothetical protein